jgi:O-antigen/teichoic acid export membrane protein
MNRQTMKRQFVAGSMYAFGAQVVSTLAALAATALLARLLDPQDLGIYFIAFSVVSLASVVAQFGLGRTVVRMTAESHATADAGRAREVIGKSLCVLAVSTVSVSLLMYAFGLEVLAGPVFHAPALVQLAGVIVPWIAMLAIRSIVAEAFRGLHDLRGANLFGDMMTRCLFLVFLVAAWTCCGDVTLRTVIALNVAALAATAAAGLLVLHRRTPPRSGAARVPVAGLVSASWPVLLTDLANGARSQADIWLLGILAGPHSVALYGAATRLALLVPMPIIVLSTVTAPYIASLYGAGRRHELQVMLTRTTAFAALLAAAASVAYVVVGLPLLRLLYGEAYAASYSLLVILAIGQLVAVIIGPFALTLTMTGHQKLAMVLTAASSAMLVVVGFALVRLFGAVGMAVANAVVISVGAAIGTVITARHTGVSTHVTLQALAPSAAFAGAKELLQALRRPRATNDTQ